VGKLTYEKASLVAFYNFATEHWLPSGPPIRLANRALGEDVIGKNLALDLSELTF